MGTESASYRDLLDSAYVRGWDDGSFAARFEPLEGVHQAGPVCQGCSPADFARLLWSSRPGGPPAGLELNAPLWYASGFAEAVALARPPVGTPAAAGRAHG
jgi:hypothetical protein